MTVSEGTGASNATVSVLVVDDQSPFRAAARAVVARVAGFELVAESESGEDAVALCASLHPDLVLMDINMGEMDGIEATRLITAADPRTLVILVSTYDLDDLPPSARTSGAAAYLNKDELSPRAVRRLWEARGDPLFPAGGSRCSKGGAVRRRQAEARIVERSDQEPPEAQRQTTERLHGTQPFCGLGRRRSYVLR